MEEKTSIVEKRVKSTIIRRRRNVVEEAETPAPEAPSAPAQKAPEVPVTPLKAEAPQAAPTAAAASQEAPSSATLPATEKKPDTPRIGIKEIRTIQLKKPFVPPSAEKKAAPVSPLAPLIEEDEDDKAKKLKVKKPIKKKGSDGLDIDVDEFGRVNSMTQLTRIVHTDRVERIFEPSRNVSVPMGVPGGMRRKKQMAKKVGKKPLTLATKAAKRFVEVDISISVSDLAKGMGIKAAEVLKKLMSMGTMATLNQQIDLDTATVLAHEFGFEVRDISFNEQKILKTDEVVNEAELKPRAPIVTIMGHVDHGKTSLLDAIRQTNITAGEAGGITQHIGAYTVSLPKGKITFLDTPGHEAFTAMRARGASVTDIVILVVAADDGIMPQTIESIDHAKAAGVPIVVAVNKIDKPEADVDRVKRQLAEHGLSPEEWGGETLYVLVSAKQKTGIEDLLESILLQAEVLDLKANPTAQASGVVVEARLDRSRGPVATILVQQGTLKTSEYLVAGCYSGRIRAMTDHLGKPVAEASPSTAVEIMGLDGVPMASDSFNVVPDEQTAAMVARNRLDEKKKKDQARGSKVSLEDFFSQTQSLATKELPVILKTDVQGSLEAVSQALVKLSTEKVKLKIIHEGVGGINESDVLLASASKAIIIGFNVRPETKALAVAQNENVDVKVYQIIYEMVSEVKLAMQGLLAPTKKEKYLGRAEVRDVFTVSKIGQVAGCYVVDGKITRGATVRILRNNVILHEGKVISLKRFKDDAREVLQNFECGVGLEGYQDIKPGDLLEAFEVELIQTEL